jgi:peptidoglycan-associated lipoprotein
MRNLIRLVALLAIATSGIFLGSTAAHAQGSPLLEVGGNYTYVYSNAPPGGCGCFSMNGGNAWASLKLTHRLSAVGEVGLQQNGDVLGTGIDLTLTSYLFGARYTFLTSSRVHPFGQALVGGAHASGRFAHAIAGGSTNELSVLAGGGLDVDLTRHLGVRAGEVDYYFTDFTNGTTDHQNNLRVSAGIYVRFGIPR